MEGVLGEISLDDRFACNEEILSNTIDGEVVMMSIEQGYYYGLDEIGSQIWEKLKTGVTLRNIVDQLLQDYDVNREKCERDLLKLMDDLVENDLVVKQGG